MREKERERHTQQVDGINVKKFIQTKRKCIIDKGMIGKCIQCTSQYCFDLLVKMKAFIVSLVFFECFIFLLRISFRGPLITAQSLFLNAPIKHQDQQQFEKLRKSTISYSLSRILLKGPLDTRLCWTLMVHSYCYSII